MRIRSIKPEFWCSETLARVDRMARLTFIGLWSYVDDNGVGVDNERLLTAALYPLEYDPAEALEGTSRDLAALADAGVIIRYQVRGKRLVFVTNWDEHQRVSHPSKPRFPRPGPAELTAQEPHADQAAADPAATSGDEPDPPGGVADSGDARESGRTVSSLSREQGTGRREVKKTSSSSSRPAAPRRDPTPTDDPAEQPDPPAKVVDTPSQADVEALCGRLHERITAGGSKATVTQGWRRAARLLLDRDGRELGEALRLVDWCQADGFWSTNVLSMPTFRKQYDRLRLRALQDPNWRWSRPPEQIPDSEIDPDAILGPDVASPPAPPREVDTGPADARRAWFESWRQQRRTVRLAEARRVLTQRAQRAGVVSA